MKKNKSEGQSHPDVEKAVGDVRRRIRRSVRFDARDTRQIFVLRTDNGCEFGGSVAQSVLARLEKPQSEKIV